MNELLKNLDSVIETLENDNFIKESNILHDIFIKISKKNKKEPITHKSPPKGYPEKKKQYADPKRFKYPIDTKEHVLAAWRYWNMPKNRKGYSDSEISRISSRIKNAGEKFKLKLK